MTPDEDEDRAGAEPGEKSETFAAQFETREQAFREARAEIDWLDELTSAPARPGERPDPG